MVFADSRFPSRINLPHDAKSVYHDTPPGHPMDSKIHMYSQTRVVQDSCSKDISSLWDIQYPQSPVCHPPSSCHPLILRPTMLIPAFAYIGPRRSLSTNKQRNDSEHACPLSLLFSFFRSFNSSVIRNLLLCYYNVCEVRSQQ